MQWTKNRLIENQEEFLRTAKGETVVIYFLEDAYVLEKIERGGTRFKTASSEPWYICNVLDILGSVKEKAKPRHYYNVRKRKDWSVKH